MIATQYYWPIKTQLCGKRLNHDGWLSYLFALHADRLTKPSFVIWTSFGLKFFIFTQIFNFQFIYFRPVSVALRRVKFSFVRNVRKIISRFILIPNIDYCRWPAIFYRMTDELITQWHVYSENVLQHFTRSLDFFSIPNYCWRWQVSLRPRRSRSFPANPSATCQTFHNAVSK